jgi:bacteriocin-like protein
MRELHEKELKQVSGGKLEAVTPSGKPANPNASTQGAIDVQTKSGNEPPGQNKGDRGANASK